MPRADTATFRKIYRAFARSAQQARAIKSDAAAVLAGGLGAVSITAFVCNAFGRVIALSPAAETLVRQGAVLTLEDGRLHSRSAHVSEALERAILIAAQTQAANDLESDCRVVLTDFFGRSAGKAQAISLPRERCDIGLGAAALLVVDAAPLGGFDTVAQARSVTGAELEVGKLLIAGSSLRHIADNRNVSIETVRSQSKAIYAKLGIRGQIELIRQFSPKSH